ncbi:MAG: DUF4397 domain-containing protein [Gammaproteobacteria bacterium]
MIYNCSMRSQTSFWLFAIALALVVGCDRTDVRVMNASPGSPELRFVVNGDTLHSNVEFAEATDFNSVESERGRFSSDDDTFSFEVFDGDTSVLGPIDLGLSTDENHLVIAVDEFSSLKLDQIRVDGTDASSEGKLRFFHAAPQRTPVRVEIEDRVTGDEIFAGDINFLNDQTVIDANSGNYELRITGSNGLDKGPADIDLEDGDNRIAILLENQSNSAEVTVKLIDADDIRVDEQIID